MSRIHIHEEAKSNKKQTNKIQNKIQHIQTEQTPNIPQQLKQKK